MSCKIKCFVHTRGIRSDIPRLSTNQHSVLEPPSLGFTIVIFCLVLVPSFSSPQPLPSISEDHPVVISTCHIFQLCCFTKVLNLNEFYGYSIFYILFSCYPDTHLWPVTADRCVALGFGCIEQIKSDGINRE